MSKTFEVTDDGQISDGHHTFKELYYYRLLYNALLFNEWAKLNLYDVHKSRLHHDGECPFGDQNMFIVVAELPTGQISNHYKMDHWDKFNIPARRLPNVYDGHTPTVVAGRMADLLCQHEWRHTAGMIIGDVFNCALCGVERFEKREGILND